ncbi:hypothetical protein JGU66_00095 [Myxococcaceae bacterium JPH2]|nr:hypothetical protein [Myxococcaceae bacterium JPH2]
MTAPPGHPSFLELDRAALGLRSPSLEQHLETCTGCRAYLSRVKQSEPVPAWARALDTDRRADERVAWTRWAWPLLATAALVAGLYVIIPGHLSEAAPTFVATKGAPAVAVYIKRGEQVFLWDGQAPLAPDDRLQLQVVAGEHHHITVAVQAPEGPEAWTVLYEGPVSPGQEMAVPMSLRVDATEGEERIRLLFSEEALPEPQAVEHLSEASTTATLWTTELRFRKSTLR